MRSLFHSISKFFQRLFSGGQVAARPADSDATVEVLPESAPLRQLIYQAIYQLPRQKRTHAAQVGALLRKQDATFSYEKYNFTKLIDLLEAVPDLVEMERVEPKSGSSNAAPVYYVRPVTDTKRLLSNALKSYQSADGWVHLESLRSAVIEEDASFSPQRYGFSDFKSFISNRTDLIEFKDNSPDYVRLRRFSRGEATPTRLIERPKKPVKSPAFPTPVRKTRVVDTNGKVTSAPAMSRNIEPLSRFAGFSVEVLNEKVSELAAIALPENWYFGPQPPAEFAYPILKSYLRYTFIRLQHEGKVLTSTHPKYRAFNTGLLDTLLRPIYGLLTQGQPQWNLDFCIAGEGYIGKKLVAQFTQLPIAANYLANADQAFYHLAAGAPQVDWQHVVKDNMARLPIDFLEQYAPADFTPRSTQGLTTPEFFDYKRAFTNALDADPAGYRNIVRKLEEALERSLRRTQVNYTTAVPTYYPKINSIDLLLPLCLADENTADLALVVRREPSGKYIGHTVLTMRQAYNNARLICKLDEHWLTRSMVLSQEDFDDEEDESAEFADEETRSNTSEDYAVRSNPS